MTDIIASPAVKEAVKVVMEQQERLGDEAAAEARESQPIRTSVLRAAQLAAEAEDHARGRQHVKGKLTARERLDLLLDTGSFEEIGRFRGGDINGGKAGDLYLHVTVKPDATFSMRGHDIVMDLPVTVGQAVAGGKVEAKDIDGNPVTFKVPAGSSSGAEVKLTGLGVQRSNQPGDLIGRVQIMVPAKPGLAVKHAAKEFDEKAGDYLSL